MITKKWLKQKGWKRITTKSKKGKVTDRKIGEKATEKIRKRKTTKMKTGNKKEKYKKNVKQIESRQYKLIQEKNRCDRKTKVKRSNC